MKLLIILANFAIVLLFLVFLAQFLERAWRKYQNERAAKDKTNAATNPSSVVDSLAHWGEQFRARLQLTPSPTAEAETIKRFREWVTRDLNKEPELQSWLLTLSEPGSALLVQHLQSFCRELNFELAWLLDQQVSMSPELNGAIRDAIIDYCQACRKAVPVQKQAKLFVQYQRLLKSPTDKAQQELSRTLYANLAKQGLTPAPEATFIVATEAERQQQTLQIIQQTATQNWLQFAQVFHATLTPNGTPLPSKNGHSQNGHLQNGHHSNGTPAVNGKAPATGKPTEQMADGKLEMQV